MRWLLTPGQESDISQAPALLEGFSPERVIADKGYDADSFIDKIRSLGAEPVIPPRSNRVEQREYDRHWYKNRNLVERFFNRIKQFRRIATRYEKLDRNFMAMIDIACICICSCDCKHTLAEFKKKGSICVKCWSPQSIAEIHRRND